MRGIALGAVVWALGACSDSDMGDVRLQLASHAAAASVEDAPGQLVVTAGTDEIVIDKVGLVLRKVRLDGPETASCPEDAEGDSRCAELRLGPVLFELPLAEGAEQVFTAAVPVGSYSGLKFQLHRPTNANEDADFVADNPDYEDISIRVTGTHNGTPFTFTSDLTHVEDVDFPEAVEVAADGELPVTLLVDVSGWFMNATGSGLVDPEQANDGGPFESLVEQQIRESFRAFHDGDGDAAAD
ncbi:MAG TPA: hypothetical protein VHG35_05745 [Gemmatimonadales bacterium]|nr:hypothetical protein [Gemmatimonadales bacterium]